jgi:hypothetical protein
MKEFDVRFDTPKLIDAYFSQSAPGKKDWPGEAPVGLGDHDSDIVLYRSVMNDLPLVALPLAISFCLLGAVIFYSVVNTSPRQLVIANFGWLLVVILLVFLLVFLLGLISYRRFNVRYVIADDGIKALRGILSNSQIDSKLEYYQIRGTEIHRTLFQRLIRTGDLHLRGATGSDVEVCFKGILYPYYFQKVIENRHRIETLGGPLNYKPARSENLGEGTPSV